MNALQPQFKIRIYKAGTRPGASDSHIPRGKQFRFDDNHPYMDIEDCVAWGVTYEEEASLLNTLTFTVDKYADVLLYNFRMGQWITLFGGYYDESGAGMRKVFVGTVIRIKSNFPDNGRISFTVTCMSYGFTSMGKDKLYYIYPDKKSPRKFAFGKAELSLAQLVEGIARDCGMEIGEISPAYQVKFTETRTHRQKDMSDWQFLHKLASQYSCYLWTEFKNGKEVFYFVDRKKSHKKSTSEIQFLYPLQGSEGIKDIKPEEVHRFEGMTWNRPRIIRNVTVDEDISLAYAVSRSALYIDKETGEEKEAIAQILTDTEGKQVTVFYELDESKVEEVNRTNPELADQIRSLGGAPKGWSSGVPDIEKETPEYTRYYYKEVKRYDNEDVAMYDNAFFGIYLKARCNQDLNIKSQVSYNVRGILRYSSNNKTGRYFLRGLRHIWEKEGAITELDFIK